ncbi:hypothetical protein BJV82DRAFT_255222 [Fennellomyces sp. T-0311]|nr:hypothetical protein BJV82DRAFT_255222 [Fennellomyces sp. T-0311]
MKAFLSICVVASMVAQAYGGITYNEDGSINLPNKMAADSGITYNSEGGIEMPYHMRTGDSGSVPMPYHIHHDGDTRQGAVTYNSEGGIVLPKGMAQGGGITYNSEGGIVLPNNMAQQANNGGGGITYNSEGGIVLPNSMAKGSESSSNSGSDDGYVDMPYRMNPDSDNTVHHGLTYNEDGGIVLPNSMAQQGGEYHQGKGTFYDAEAHVAACGKTHVNTERVVALSAKRMGDDKSSNNENCGKRVLISGPSGGEQVEAEVVDFCMTCDDDGLDMTPAVFEKISDFSSQDVPIKWKFIS